MINVECFEKLVEEAKEAKRNGLTQKDWEASIGWADWMDDMTEAQDGEEPTEKEMDNIQRVLNEAWDYE